MHCRDITKSNNHTSDIINNLDFFVYVKLLISKSKQAIIIPKLDRFKAKLKKVGLIVPVLNNNIRQPNQYSQKHDFPTY